MLSLGLNVLTKRGGAMSIVAMDMNTTTENSDSVSTPTLRSMLAMIYIAERKENGG